MTVYEVHKILAERYKDMTNSGIKSGNEGLTVDKMEFGNIVWMCDSIIDLGANWPIDKVARWIGFIQATIIASGLTSVDAERDFSRPLFHSAYNELGIALPETRTRQ